VGFSGLAWTSQGKLVRERYDINREGQMLRPDPYSFFSGPVKNFHNLNLLGILGIGLVKWRKLDGENYGFEVGASKLFNNSTTSPTPSHVTSKDLNSSYILIRASDLSSFNSADLA
jgi:hypothetical protein